MKHPASEAGGIFKKNMLQQLHSHQVETVLLWGELSGTEVSQHKQIYLRSHKLVFPLE